MFTARFRCKPICNLCHRGARAHQEAGDEKAKTFVEFTRSLSNGKHEILGQRALESWVRAINALRTSILTLVSFRARTPIIALGNSGCPLLSQNQCYCSAVEKVRIFGAAIRFSPMLRDPTAHTNKNYKWAVVGMLWFVCFFNYADRQSISSIFPKLKAEFGFDEVQLGFIGSAFMWIYAAGAPFAGFIADHFPRKHLILGGCLFWSGVTVMTGWCARLWQFVAVRALEGFGETFYFPATMSLVSDYHDRRTRSRAMSWHQSSVYVGTIVGSWAGAWFAEKMGWRVGFYFFGGAGVVLALVLYVFLREPVRGAADDPGDPAMQEPLKVG